MLIHEILKEKRNEIINIASSNGVTKISLFGSVLRNENNESSDIDFLVEFEKDRTLFDLIRLKQELEKLLGRPVDVVTKNAVHWTIRDQVLSEAVQL